MFPFLWNRLQRVTLGYPSFLTVENGPTQRYSRASAIVMFRYRDPPMRDFSPYDNISSVIEGLYERCSVDCR